MTESLQPGEPPPVKPPAWRRWVFGRNPRRTLVRAAVLGTLTLVVFKFILLPVRISGGSMEPTYHDRGINLVNRLAYLWRPPKRGDVVAVRTSGLHIMYLKRIIGLPGETIELRHGVVFIDGRALDEPYVRERDDWDEAPCKLGTDYYFLIGDNRGMPKELHEYGRVKAQRIVGKVLW